MIAISHGNYENKFNNQRVMWQVGGYASGQNSGALTNLPSGGGVAGAAATYSPTNADWQTVWNNGYNNNGNKGVGGDWLNQAYSQGQAAYQAKNTQTGGAGTGGTGGNPTPTGALPDTSSLNNSANSGMNSTMAAIQNKLNLVRDQANQQIQNAQGTRDYVVNFINQRYPELINRATQAGQNLQQDLSGQKTDLTNLYDRAVAQARKRSEDAALTNRMAARAGNRLGSSFYDQIVQNNQENLGSTLGASDMERISKLAGIDTQSTRVQQDTNNQITDLNSQKDQATYSAFDEYKNAVQQADYLSKAGLADFGSEQAAAENNLQSKLDSIAQWAQGMAQQKQALDAQYGTTGDNGSVGTALANTATGNSAFLTNNAITPQATNVQNFSSALLGTGAQTNGNNAANQMGMSNQKPLTLQDILNGVTSGGLTVSQ